MINVILTTGFVLFFFFVVCFIVRNERVYRFRTNLNNRIFEEVDGASTSEDFWEKDKLFWERHRVMDTVSYNNMMHLRDLFRPLDTYYNEDDFKWDD